MAKASLRIPTKEAEKHFAAASWAGVGFDLEKVVGPNTFIELTYNDINKVLEMGAHLTTLTPEQVKEETARRKKEAEEEAKAASAAK